MQDLEGKLIGFEMITQDIEKAQSFYKELFSWSFQEMPGTGGNYFTCHTSDREVVGAFRVNESREQLQSDRAIKKKSGPVVYVGVDEVDSFLERAEKAGARVVSPKKKISDEHGYVLQLQDLEENTIGVWARR